MNHCRYRLQRKEPYVMPNVLGGHSFPVYTHRWVDIAISDDLNALMEIKPNDENYRIEDTQPHGEDGDNDD